LTVLRDIFLLNRELVSRAKLRVVKCFPRYCQRLSYDENLPKISIKNFENMGQGFGVSNLLFLYSLATHCDVWLICFFLLNY